VPIDEAGKLNAKQFLGGKAKLTAMQTDFAGAMRGHGLERGLEGSKAKHQSIQDYYGKIKILGAEAPQITADDLKSRGIRSDGLLGRLGFKPYRETQEGVAERLNTKVGEVVEPYRAKASEVSQARQEAKEARKAMVDQQKALKPFLDALRPLNEAERATLAVAMTMDSAKMVKKREALEQERKAERQRLLDIRREKNSMGKKPKPREMDL
jgi:hypothetical protein